MIDEETQKYYVRVMRNKYLEETDFSRLDDVPLTDEKRESYKAYRIYLRDYTEHEQWWLQYPKTYEEWLNDIL